MFEYKINLLDPNYPLYVMVHGRGGNSSVMSLFKKAIPEKSNQIYPQAPWTDPIIGGFSWWDATDRENMGERVTPIAQDFLNDLKEIIRLNNLTPSQIHACGFSQGGALLSVCIQQENIFDSFSMLCSFFIPLHTNFKAPKSFLFHGESDEVISYEKALESKLILESHGADVTFISDKSGHKITSAGIKALTGFWG